MTRKTLKQKYRKKGGDIDARNGLKYILSIGYEMEAGTFSKLTKTDVVDNPGDLVLFNSETARTDILTFKKLMESENFEILDEDLISRMEEKVDEVAYNDKNEVDNDIVFYITNDMSKTPFISKIQKICYIESDDEDDEDESNDDNEDDEEAANEAAIEAYVNKLNKLFMFRTLTGDEYKLHFIFKDKRDCGEFSNVEWLFTYLKPKQTTSIVIDTFTNALTNLLRHLSDLEEIEGKFIVNTDDGEVIIDKPEVRSLYHKPGTNLYYLDTHILDKKFTLDDICLTSQMTFSCYIENVMLVMKTLITDNYNTITSISDDSKYKINVLDQLEICIEKLLESYNEKETIFKLIMTRTNAKIIKKIMGYLYLIMFKLSRYYNGYLKIEKDKRKYFKNSLFFAVRHDNSIFYAEIKKNLKVLFLQQLNEKYNGDEVEINKGISEIIQRIVVQPDVLYEYFLEESITVRKNAFNPSNILEKNTNRYGDPEFSLISYFHFFENPTDTSNNMTYVGDGEERKQILFTNEWFVFSQIDNKSARMELKDDIVLIEFRGFQKMLTNYVFNIADNELKDLMRTGICNEIKKKYSEDVGALSIKIFKKVLELRNKQSQSVKRNKTRKTKSSP